MKKKKLQTKTKTNKNQGITLIALVITIIVLLILAAVSIATLTGDNGILTKAQTAKEKNDTAEKEETQKLLQAEANMSFEETEYNGVTIPAGMAPTRKEGESTVNEGLVAVDKNGNEWVWIEVPKSIYTNPDYNGENPPTTENDCDKIEEVLKAYAAPYTEGKVGQGYYWTDEWYADKGVNDIVTENTVTIESQKNLDTGCGLTLSQYKETYQKMIKSVYKNGGFWIGRYEAGIEGTTGTDEESLKLGRTESSARIDNVSTAPKAISQKDAIPYNNVYCSEAQKLAKEMTPDSSKTSSLLFGIQWDLVCKFIEEKEVKKQEGSNRESIKASINSDSGEWGNYMNKTFAVKDGKCYILSSSNGYGSTATWQKIPDNYEKPIVKPGPPEGVALFSTGITERNKKVNIYDFAGNEYEWTLEHATVYTSDPCSCRGGVFHGDSSVYPASYRIYDNTTSSYDYTSFRPVLY